MAPVAIEKLAFHCTCQQNQAFEVGWAGLVGLGSWAGLLGWAGRAGVAALGWLGKAGWAY